MKYSVLIKRFNCDRPDCTIGLKQYVRSSLHGIQHQIHDLHARTRQKYNAKIALRIKLESCDSYNLLLCSNKQIDNDDIASYRMLLHAAAYKTLLQ